MTGLLAAWAGRAEPFDWQVLDASGGDLHHWRDLLDAWRADAKRPRRLNYIAFIQPELSAPVVSVRFEQQTFEEALGATKSRAVLTQVSGERHAALRELRMAADVLVLPSFHDSECTPWTAKLLARCCRRGTRLLADSLTEPARHALAAQGFELEPMAKPAGQGTDWSGRYNPRWNPKTPSTPQLEPGQPRRCTVIGAGLAGASTAYALAARGWAVQVLDAALQPAMGASSLPGGLMVAHPSADDNPRSRLLRAGLQLASAEAGRWLVRGQEWDDTGVLTLKPGQAPNFQSGGAWVKPAALVKAWLAQPGITFTGGQYVAGLAWRDAAAAGGTAGGEWQILNAEGAEIAKAPMVILAAAAGCSAILSNTKIRTKRPKKPIQLNGAGYETLPLPRLTTVAGQVSWGLQQPADEAWTPSFSVNGNGYLATGLPMPGGAAWLTGSTFEDGARTWGIEAAHAHNLVQLGHLLPGAAAALRGRFEAQAVMAWRHERCTTSDRLPLVGPAHEGVPGLWLNTGFGARGLTWSVLCAGLLAARLCGTPWPVEASLAGKLDNRAGLRR